jgi:hypothetical protein
MRMIRQSIVAVRTRRPSRRWPPTRPLLFLEDGSYFADKATAMNLTGTQWGVMNEAGSYPGQPWLWLYQLWYQLPGFRTSANADLIAIYLTGEATVLLLLVPFIPGLRDIPRWIPVHRLIWWRNWDQQAAGSDGRQPDTGPKPEPAGQKGGGPTRSRMICPLTDSR